ncbi:MAG: polysaccharide biosynthesis/export family protein [Bacteroidetes bacterium]|jgi:polysaccharide biosynthesis/export protein|nr:polysaccharide biosynthesis/export family protein [Bacteroidota bacterium]
MLQLKVSSFIKLLVLLLIIQGCTPMSKITYLNDSQSGEWDVSPIPPKHHLEIGDILMVRVISRNEESNNLFNIESNTNSANSTLTAANLYLNGFTISQEGTIDIPNVGEVFVLNQTLEEAESTISLKAEEFLINPFVIVKLANFQFTVLGEINAPGNYPVYKEGLTIYDAIAMSGGINDYGNLKKIKIVRSEKNKKQIYNVDLTSSNILTSDFFYLRNNDLIYVQPLKFKGFKKSQSQLLLSALTTFAVLFNVYLKISE